MSKPEQELQQTYRFTLPNLIRNMSSQSETVPQKPTLQIPSLITDPHLIAIAKRYEEALFPLFQTPGKRTDDAFRLFKQSIIETASTIAWTTINPNTEDEIITDPETGYAGYLIVIPPGHPILKEIHSIAEPLKHGSSYIAFRPEKTTKKYAASLLSYALSSLYQQLTTFPHNVAPIDQGLLRTAIAYDAKFATLDLLMQGQLFNIFSKQLHHYGKKELSEILKTDSPQRRKIFKELDKDIYGGPAKNPRETSGRETLYIHGLMDAVLEDPNLDPHQKDLQTLSYMREYHDWVKRKNF